MASTIEITLPALNVDYKLHEAIHNDIWLAGGKSLDCPHCAERWQAKESAEKIVLAAFPNLDNRSELQSDYFDYCLSFN